MNRVRYEYWSGGGCTTSDMTHAVQCLQIAFHMATLHAAVLWNKPVIEVPLRALELSQGGILTFVQTVHRICAGTEMYAEIGARSADVVVKYYYSMEQRGSLRVAFPLNAYDVGMRGENIVMTLEMDRWLFGHWFLPLASQRPITVGWERVVEKRGVPVKKNYFTSTPFEEW